MLSNWLLRRKYESGKDCGRSKIESRLRCWTMRVHQTAHLFGSRRYVVAPCRRPITVRSPASSPHELAPESEEERRGRDTGRTLTTALTTTLARASASRHSLMRTWGTFWDGPPEARLATRSCTVRAKCGNQQNRESEGRATDILERLLTGGTVWSFS